MNSATQRVLVVLGLIVAAVALFFVLQHTGFVDYAPIRRRSGSRSSSLAC
jgi:hypothetical protein